MSSNGNYHSQQRRYFVSSDGGRLHGQPQQSAHAAANGLPQMPPGAAAKSSDSLARLHHNNYDQLRACSQTGQQQSCHFYGPIESMSTHRANSNNNNNLASGSAHHRQERPAAVFATDPSEHYPDRVRSHRNRSNNNNNQHPQHQLQHQHQQHEHRKRDQMSTCQTNQEQHHLSECHCSSDRSQRSAFEQRHDCDWDQYANQLRRSCQLQTRIENGVSAQNHRSEPPTPASFHVSAAPRHQMQTDGHMPAQLMMRHQDQKTTASQQQAGGSSGASQQQQPKEPLHVNFNRSSQAIGAAGKEIDDDESGESTRKKKYLTAKYGQQQMNLIKKRLKIEMWLHDQLQELAKQSNTIEPDELDEIDIDLDQLLDMDDDSTRRRWLRKTLEPLSGLPNESLEKFFDEVLEQSKLL